MKRLFFVLSFFLSVSAGAQAGFYALMGGDTTTSVPVVYDADAQNYFDRLLSEASFTPSGADKTYVNNIIIGLKEDGNWTPAKEIWLFFWQNAAANSIPVKDLVANATWSAGVVHGAGGVTGTTSTDYGNTNFVPSAHFTTNSSTIGIYLRTTNSTASVWDAGSRNSTSQTFEVSARQGATNAVGDLYNTTTTAGRLQTANATALGFNVWSRTASNAYSFYRNGISRGSITTTGGSLPTQPIYALALNISGAASSGSLRQMAAMIIMDGIDAAHVASLNTRFETLMDNRGIGVQ